MENRREKRQELFRAVNCILGRQADGEEDLAAETVDYLEKLHAALSGWLDDESDEADCRFLSVLGEFRAYLGARDGEDRPASPASRLH